MVRRWAAAGLTVATLACSPVLDWREVRLEGLQAMLPCKPDHGERTVQLGTLEVRMQMSGCEAGGALYAISHVRVQGADQAIAAQAAWRSAALANIQASVVQSQTIKLGKPSTAIVVPPGEQSLPTDSALDLLSAQGTQPDGKPVQARLVWIAAGDHLYHVAVYGPKLDNERLETLFIDLRLQ
jgi:hypothetical protein